MPEQPKEPDPPMTLMQQLQFIQWAIRFPSLSVMVFLRPDIGYRLLSPIALCGIAFIMFVFGSLFGDDGNDLFIFTGVMLALGLWQRFARARLMRQGIKHHSYFLGTSALESVLPKIFRDRANHFADPAVCAIAGYILLHYSRALGLWLIFSGLCLRLYEFLIFRRELNQVLDLTDGLITTTAQSQIVEHFEKPQGTKQIQPSQGIPTGLGSDIEGHIEQRKRNTPP